MTVRISTTCTLGDITVAVSADSERPVRLQIPDGDLTREQALHLHMALGAHLAQTMRAPRMTAATG